MTEISSHFALIDPELIRDTMKLQRVTYIPAGSQEFSCAAPISLTQTPSTGNDGSVWTISFRAVTKDCAVRDYNGRRYYVAVIMSDGSARIIGTASEVPLVTVTPYGNSSEVTTIFRAAVPIDL